MKKVVYILGAGFSAPLGIPVMATFLTRAKDLYSAFPDKFGYFMDIFTRIDFLSKAKNYLQCDLFNIEEILSILEMQSYVGDTDFTDQFTRFIADVITACTPMFPDYKRPENPERFEEGIFSAGDHRSTLLLYGNFLATTLGLEFEDAGPDAPPRCSCPDKDRTRYGFISLNYDMVLENLLAHLNQNYACPQPFVTTTSPEGHDAYDNAYRFSLAKLHGSIEPPSIVPPTWNKTRREEVQNAWRLAHDLVSQANYVRILGYSLPKTDVYMKYLLTTGIIDSLNMKGIDVVCLDPDGSVCQRYTEMIDFTHFRFKNENMEKYLREVGGGACGGGEGPRQQYYRYLEYSHGRFFDEPDPEFED